MSTDWREKEREFLTSLKADSGRDLGEWMRVISAQNLRHRNDIIDWLRQNGFTFARASWLERIHHNAGRPVYLDPADLLERAIEHAVPDEQELKRVATGGNTRAFYSPPPHQPPASRDGDVTPLQAKPLYAAPPTEALSQQPELRNQPVVSAPVSQQPKPSPSVVEPARASPPPGARSPTNTAERDDVLGKAKAYRPLAVHLLRLIENAVPEVEIDPAATHLTLKVRSQVFGLVAISSKDIRLVLRLGTQVASQPLVAVKLPVTLTRPAQDMTHMAVLTDARQLDEALIGLVKTAANI